MCGIAGTSLISNLDSFRSSLQFIERRGPDNTGAEDLGGFYFGHTRLAIVDLDERSNQPFNYVFKERSIWCTFNGEVYNFIKLKDKLMAEGFDFRTSSDTEVICAAYVCWGKKCFDYFEGMWALAIWDEENQEMVFSRDRVGKKPLYYYCDKGFLTFSSSLNFIIHLHPQLKQTLSKEGLEMYFGFGFTADKHSIYSDVFKVTSGQILSFKKSEEGNWSIANQSQSIHDYTPVPFSGIKNAIQYAVDERMLCDVPFCTLLSSGVDSSIITDLAHVYNKDVEAYTVGFDDKSLDETQGAKNIASRIGIKLNELYLKEEDLNAAFEDYYQVYEEPFADYSGIPSIALFKKISEYYKLVFTGDGGDEIFYGYPHYVKKWILYNLNRINRIVPISKLLPAKINDIVSCESHEFETEYLRLNVFVSEFVAKNINEVFKGIQLKNKSFLRSTIKFDRIINNLPEKYLVKVDRASMFVGVEVRSPFMDEKLRDFVDRKKLFLTFTPFSLKLILKILYFPLFGIKYFFAKKKGFTPPIKKLVLDNFNASEYEELKKMLHGISGELSVFFSEIPFDTLQSKPMLLIRVFFFSKWLKQNVN